MKFDKLLNRNSEEYINLTPVEKVEYRNWAPILKYRIFKEKEKEKEKLEKEAKRRGEVIRRMDKLNATKYKLHPYETAAGFLRSEGMSIKDVIRILVHEFKTTENPNVKNNIGKFFIEIFKGNYAIKTAKLDRGGKSTPEGDTCSSVLSEIQKEIMAETKKSKTRILEFKPGKSISG